MLWLVFALLTIATVAALAWPLLRPAAEAPARAACDLAVYRNQLAEVEADLERGLLAPAQAEAARLEIQRRMLAAPQEAPPPPDDRKGRRMAAIVIAVMMPVCAGLLYFAYGSPQLPDKPYAERLQNEPAVALAAATDKLAAGLVIHPNAPGYLKLADMLLQQGNYDGGVEAYRRAIEHGADNAVTWSGLGEALVLASGGAVGPQALAAFARALSLDAAEPRARFYAGLAEIQIGHLKKAAAIWRDLEKTSTNVSLRLFLHSEIEKLGKQGGFDPETIPPNPPSAQALAAAVDAMTGAMSNMPKR